MEQMRESAFDRETLEARSAELETKYEQAMEQANGLLNEIKVLSQTLERMEMKVEQPKEVVPTDAEIIAEYNRLPRRSKLSETMNKFRNFREENPKLTTYTKYAAMGAVATSGLSGIIHDPNIFVQNLIYNSVVGGGLGVIEELYDWVLYKKKSEKKNHD